MSDYSQLTLFTPKDALSTGNPAKLIKGADIDPEFAAIATAITSKFDSTDIASNAEAAALTLDTKIITPAKFSYIMSNVDFGFALETVTITAGAGLTGGGDLSANRTLAIGAGAGITVNADDVALTSGVNASPGSYTLASITVDTYGRVTAASSGTAANAPLTAMKTTDTARTSTTTLADDPHLTLTLEANSYYIVDLYLEVATGGAGPGGAKVQLTSPAGATAQVPVREYDPAGTYTGDDTYFSGGTANTTNTINGSIHVHGQGFVYTAGTAGTFVVQWAQQVSDATAVTLKKGSYLRAQKVA